MTEPKLHLAIIPDGNRRWARAQSMLPWKGHERAVENFRGLTDWCRTDGRVGTLTMWCFSTENWKRAQTEIDALMGLLESYLMRERQAMAQNGVRLLHSGRTDRIPAKLATLLQDVQEETEGGTSLTLHLAIDYGGKDELLRAIRRLPDSEHVDEDTLRACLDHPDLPDMDLILRTSGEQRTSNFFLWQSTYAEWIFLPQHFPELTPTDLDQALQTFAERKRRYGA